MRRGQVYDALKAWLETHGYDAGYQLQKRFWGDKGSDLRYIVIQQNGGGLDEEAVTRDYFRILVISAQNDPDDDEVEDRADAIRQTMLDDYQTGGIILMKPLGGLPAMKTSDGRLLFEITFQTIISR
ncbi:TPA: hypothetical protein N2G45_002891 [Salmonella enterica]|nr:hypothetical protein [Salmonella enterica]